MPLRSNFEPGTSRWATRRAQWRALGLTDEDTANTMHLACEALGMALPGTTRSGPTASRCGGRSGRPRAGWRR